MADSKNCNITCVESVHEEGAGAVGEECRAMKMLRYCETILGDGAMGTMLHTAGLPTGSCPELWNVEHPEVVGRVHEAYIAAGSMMIATNTFGGNRFRLGAYGAAHRVRELNTAGARIARCAAQGYGVLVAGSMGPTGDFLMPLGTLDAESVEKAYEEQAEALAQGGVDLFIIETMSDLAEVQAAVTGVRRASSLPIAVTMTFGPAKRTMMGVSPEQAVAALTELDIFIAGANCGTSPKDMEGIMAAMARVKSEGMYLMAQSNAGLPVIEGGEIRYLVDPTDMGLHARTLRSLGVSVIGACCGSTPEHISAMKEALELRTP